ncbi:hypothetical protein H072_4849 [Dactylellina haptotyla CBS 200.50]|uniref:NACHT domain-containing protein n=1 Tax=Dactylellina haptotyla (strain CBS 200.50) TaxID=1284197 RepID=S8C0R8_DACHA|nr:hypothetical protein H072_4849 [Dactylellina haptotyla CBS 200.50]
MSGTEFIAVAAVISSIIAIVDGVNKVVDAALDAEGLPKVFRQASHKLPIISDILDSAKSSLEKKGASEIERSAKIVIDNCSENWQKLKDLFEKVIPDDKASKIDRYYRAVRTLGKGGKVENLMKEMLESVQLLSSFRILTVSKDEEVVQPDINAEKLEKIVSEVTSWEPSVPDSIFEEGGYIMNVSGTGHMVAQGEFVKQNILKDNARQIEMRGGNYYEDYYHTVNKTIVVDEIDRTCLRALRCPDSEVVMNNLKESKGKLVRQSIDWILYHPHYVSWKDGSEIGLLWIKGGAGKGKTMMVIGLIDILASQHLNDSSIAVTYFFCQNANLELNTLESIIKGLILQLIKHDKGLNEILLRHWNAKKECFDQDVESWKVLWDLFLEMLYQCKFSKVYVVVDALDECSGVGMAGLLKRLVRTGLDRPSKLKWLLTSRPLPSAETELLTGSDQVLVSLEINSEHVSNAVKSYIKAKVIELDHRHTYGSTLRQQIQDILMAKAKGTYLWVSLVCKTLEKVSRNDALTMVDDLPEGLYPLYNRALNDLGRWQPHITKKCRRLLKAMMLALRPLSIDELGSVAALYDDSMAVSALVDRCTSFIFVRKANFDTIEFVHQSARDYLAGRDGRSILNSDGEYGHGDVALSCISHLTQRLEINLGKLQLPSSPRTSMNENSLVISLDYAASFWAQHLNNAQLTSHLVGPLDETGEVGAFLHNKFLQWVEALSLLDKFTYGIMAMEILSDLSVGSFTSKFAKDAIRFLLRNRHTISSWPLQIYSSALAFSSPESMVRRCCDHEIPVWFTSLPKIKDIQESLVQTFEGSGENMALSFSADGRSVISISSRGKIHQWDVDNGQLQETSLGNLNRHRHPTQGRAYFSPDLKKIAISEWELGGAWRKMRFRKVKPRIKLYDLETGDILQTFRTDSHTSEYISKLQFSPDNMHLIAVLSKRNGHKSKNNYKLWNITTGELKREGIISSVSAISFSPNGDKIASSYACVVTISCPQTGKTYHAFKCCKEPNVVKNILFSSDGEAVISVSGAPVKGKYSYMAPDLVQKWRPNPESGEFSLSFELASNNRVRDIATFPNNMQIASIHSDDTICIWDILTGNLQRKFKFSSSFGDTRMVISPDSRWVMLYDFQKFELLDCVTGNHCKLQSTGSGWFCVYTGIFSPDSQRFASMGPEKISLWDIRAYAEARAVIPSPQDAVRDLVLSPDCNYVVLKSWSSGFDLWDAKVGSFLRSLTAPAYTFHPSAIAYSPDSSWIVGVFQGHFYIWDIATGSTHQKFYPLEPCAAIAISADKNKIAVVSESYDKPIQVYDIETSSFHGSFGSYCQYVGGLAFSPDNQKIALVRGGNTLEIWNVGKPSKLSRQIIKTLRSHNKVGLVARMEIEANAPIKNLEWTKTGELETNRGCFIIGAEGGFQSRPSLSFRPCESFIVQDNWIKYGSLPLVKIPSEINVSCSNTKGDLLVLGLEDGRVLTFWFNRSELDLMLQNTNMRDVGRNI